jgi:hypothetical protein
MAATTKPASAGRLSACKGRQERWPQRGTKKRQEAGLEAAPHPSPLPREREYGVRDIEMRWLGAATCSAFAQTWALPKGEGEGGWVKKGRRPLPDAFRSLSVSLWCRFRTWKRKLSLSGVAGLGRCLTVWKSGWVGGGQGVRVPVHGVVLRR